MYSQILVPLDGSDLAEQVLPYVQQIAPGLKIPLEFLRVIEPVNPEMAGVAYRPVASPLLASGDTVTPLHTAPTSGPRAPYLDQIVASQRSHAQDYLDKLAAVARQAGLSATTSVHEGSPAHYIVEEAQKDTDTLIAMTTHGRSGIPRWVLGSVMDKVLHATTNPLLVVRPQDYLGTKGELKFSSVIVPLDGSDLAEQILPHVVSLARALSFKVILVRVTPSAADYYRYMEYSIGPYQDYSKEVDAGAVDYLHAVNQRLGSQKIYSVEERLLRGNPAAAIVDLAKEVTGSMVAMTTHGRSGVGRWVLGSVADRVVRHSGEPVLLVRAR